MFFELKSFLKYRIRC